MPGYQGGFNGNTLEDVLDYIARLDRTMTYLMGQLDTENIREIGGWRVEPGVIRSKDYDVGMSTEDVGFNPVRFWAGGTNPDSAPWRVHQDGSGVATGWTLQTKGATYPRLVMDPASDLLGAYAGPSNSLRIVASHSSYGGSPTIFWQSAIGNAAMYLGVGDGSLIMDSNEGIGLFGGFSGVYLTDPGPVWVQSFSNITERSSFRNLQTALDDLQSEIDDLYATKSSIFHNHLVTIPTHTHTVSGSTAQAGGGGTFVVS